MWHLGKVYLAIGRGGDGVLLIAHPAPRHPRIGHHQQSTMQSLRNGADGGTTALPGDGDPIWGITVLH